MRKLKEDYTLFYSYKNKYDEIDFIHITYIYEIQKCINNDMKRDVEDCEIIDYQFFTPEGKRCTLDEATERVIEIGTYWKCKNSDVFMIVADRQTLPKFNYIHYPRFAVMYSNGECVGFSSAEFNDFVQVKNWNGEPL